MGEWDPPRHLVQRVVAQRPLSLNVTEKRTQQRDLHIVIFALNKTRNGVHHVVLVRTRSQASKTNAVLAEVAVKYPSLFTLCRNSLSLSRSSVLAFVAWRVSARAKRGSARRQSAVQHHKTH